MLWSQSVHGSAGYEATRQVPQVVGCAAAAVGGAGGTESIRRKVLDTVKREIFLQRQTIRAARKLGLRSTLLVEKKEFDKF